MERSQAAVPLRKGKTQWEQRPLETGIIQSFMRRTCRTRWTEYRGTRYRAMKVDGSGRSAAVPYLSPVYPVGTDPMTVRKETG